MIDSKCMYCTNIVLHSLSEMPICNQCKEKEMRKSGWRPWEELTVEEKLENLNNRLNDLSWQDRPIG